LENGVYCQLSTCVLASTDYGRPTGWIIIFDACLGVSMPIF
jgi:hypothetical protein